MINSTNQQGINATVYPFDYQRHPQTITAVNYVTELNGAKVTCTLTLSNEVKIAGTHEQYHDKSQALFENKAYQQAIERAEQLGYKLSV